MAQIGYESRSGVGWVTMPDGDHGNSFDSARAGSLLTALRAAERDQVGVLVLRAEGRFFSVGGDLGQFEAAGNALPEQMDELTALAHRIIGTLAHSDMIVLAAVQGMAAGIGFPLAMAADLVVAADTARFTLGYTRVGLTGDGGTGLLVRSIGLHRTLRLALLNDVLTAEEAYRLGLLARVVPAAELDDHVADLAAALAAGSRQAQAGIKNIVRTAAAADLEAHLAREARAMVAATRHPDVREGVNAFFAKRSPRFGAAVDPNAVG